MSSPEPSASLFENPDNYRPANPLLELLRAIRLTGVLAGHALMSAPWGVELPHPEDTILIYFVDAGRCVALLQEEGRSVELCSGDVLLVLRPCRHGFADSPGTPLHPLEPQVRNGMENAASAEQRLGFFFRTKLHLGGGGVQTEVNSLRLFVDSRFPNPLRRGAPQFAHLKGFRLRNRHFVDTMFREIDDSGSAGFHGQSIATRLSEALLTKCLKEVLEGEATEPGIFRALKDPFVARALGEMQRHPERDWSLERLSRAAGLSRSALLERFEHAIGMTPAHFQAKLRMGRAVDLIENSSLTLAEIAIEVGYSSEAAFNRAFRREMGRTPGELRRNSAGAGPAS